MAVLTTAELNAMRRHWADLAQQHGLTKAQVNAGLQAIEDRFESARNVLNNDVDTAIAPATMTTNQKKFLLGVWCVLKAVREGVI